MSSEPPSCASGEGQAGEHAGRPGAGALCSVHDASLPAPPALLCCAGDGVEEDAAAATLGLPYVRVLLAPAEHYPADRVASWRPDATGGPGLPFTQLSVQHVVAAAGLAAAADGGLTEQGGDGALVGNKHGHGGTAALEALAASGGSGGAAGSDEGAGGTQRDQQAQSELGGA